MIRFHKISLALLLTAGSTLAQPCEMHLSFQITGVKKEIKTNVTNRLQNAEEKLQHPYTKNAILNFYRQAPQEIEKALQPYGYFHAITQSHLSIQGNQAILCFNIILGDPIRIHRVRLSVTGPGIADPEFHKLLRKFPLKPKQKFNSEKYQKAKQSFIDLASERGYFDAKMLRSKILIDLQKYEANIFIDFLTGRRYCFGDTIIEQSPFALCFLQRFMTYAAGEPYDYKKIEKTQQGLTNSNYFQEVIVNPLIDRIHNCHVPVHILLIPRKPIQYILGLGYGTDTGIRATVGLALRRLNAYGHRLNFLIQASQRNSEAVANYSIPGLCPATDQLLFSAGLGRIRQTTGNSNSGRLAASYITAFGDLQQTVALTYLNERYQLIDIGPPIFIYNNAQLVYPNVNWHILETDDAWKPTRGFRASLDLAGAPDNWTRNNRSGFFQIRFDTKGLFTFEPTHTRFLGRFQYGHTAIRNLTNLPLSLQLFAGGALSIRGFLFNSIGPARNLIVGSVEVQQRIWGDFYLGAFIDAGSVSNHHLEDLNVGAGPAFIWLSPVGMLELTLAKPLHISSEVFPRPRKKWMIQFNMGTDL